MYDETPKSIFFTKNKIYEFASLREGRVKLGLSRSDTSDRRNYRISKRGNRVYDLKLIEVTRILRKNPWLPISLQNRIVALYAKKRDMDRALHALIREWSWNVAPLAVKKLFVR